MTDTLAKSVMIDLTPLWYDAAVSLRRIVVGFVIGVAAGIALGASCPPAG